MWRVRLDFWVRRLYGVGVFYTFIVGLVGVFLAYVFVFIVYVVFVVFFVDDRVLAFRGLNSRFF